MSVELIVRCYCSRVIYKCEAFKIFFWIFLEDCFHSVYRLLHSKRTLIHYNPSTLLTIPKRLKSEVLCSMFGEQWQRSFFGHSCYIFQMQRTNNCIDNLYGRLCLGKDLKKAATYTTQQDAFNSFPQPKNYWGIRTFTFRIRSLT